MGPKTFQKIIDHVYPTRHKYSRDSDEVWDYPNYGGLSNTIAMKLSSEAVDAMQYIIQAYYNRKRDFAKAYKNKLEELGERGWWKCKIK